MESLMDDVSNSQALRRPKVDHLPSSEYVSPNAREAATSMGGREN